MTVSNTAPIVGAHKNATWPDEPMRLAATGSSARSTRTGSVPKLAASNHT